MKQNVFRSSRVPLYHRASNGAAGRSVQTSKAVLTKQVLNGKANTLSLKHRLVLKLSQGNLPLNCVWNDRLGTETQPQQSSRGATVEAERAPGWRTRKVRRVQVERSVFGTRVEKEEHHADSYVTCGHSLSRWRTLNNAYLLDLTCISCCCHANQLICSRGV